MKLKQYQIAEKNDSRKLAQFLSQDGQGSVADGRVALPSRDGGG